MLTTDNHPLAPQDQLALMLQCFEGLSARAQEQLAALYPLYKEWNERINVVSRRDIDNLYLHHVMHSLSLSLVLPHADAPHAVCDVGCGGGLPGIPLAILYPEYRFALIDSTAKKLRVAQSVAHEIGLTNVAVYHTRAEESDLTCDYIVSRAAMSLSELWKNSRHLLFPASTAPKSGIYCLKGGELEDEIAASGLMPEVISIPTLGNFPDYYRDKYILYIAKQPIA